MIFKCNRANFKLVTIQDKVSAYIPSFSGQSSRFELSTTLMDENKQILSTLNNSSIIFEITFYLQNMCGRDGIFRHFWVRSFTDDGLAIVKRCRQNSGPRNSCILIQTRL